MIEFVGARPDWHGRSPAVPRLESPVRWQGMPVSWEDGYMPIPVFIGQAVVSDDHNVYLFGARWETSQATIKGRSLPEGFFLEYYVVDYLSSGWTSQRLRQARGPVFGPAEERDDWRSVPDLSSDTVSSLSLDAAPVWADLVSAQWPTNGDRPMRFVRQFELSENETTRTLLTRDQWVYLFVDPESSADPVYKVVTQDTDGQSIEDHYAQE